MTEPKPIKARSEYVKSYMGEFKQKHIVPALERVRARPESLEEEAHKLFNAAKGYFTSRARGRPHNKEALYLFARERLDDLVNDTEIAAQVIGEWEGRGSQFRLARLILYPLGTWTEYMWSYESRGFAHVPQPGFIEYARSLARSSSGTSTRPGPPPPPAGDPLELGLEANVLAAEEELAKQKDALKAYREAREKAAQERTDREREAKERADREAAERQARERVERERLEREAREKAEREKSEREARERAERDRAASQNSRHHSGRPQWAIILNLSPPFTEERIRAAYRAKAKLTHPDLGGTDKEFREVDVAYDSAMRFCQS